MTRTGGSSKEHECGYLLVDTVSSTSLRLGLGGRFTLCLQVSSVLNMSTVFNEVVTIFNEVFMIVFKLNFNAHKPHPATVALLP